MSTGQETSPSSAFSQEGAETFQGSEETEIQTDIGTYEEMFREYVKEQDDWITSKEKPLVFHTLSVCRQIDARLARGSEPPAALFGAYLQSVERLNKRRPAENAPSGGPAQIDGQTDVFDFME